MPFDGFIEIEGIKGDSTDAAHKDWIEILGFQHAITQPTGGASSGQGTHAGGRADHGDLVITKRLDSASPVLAAHCCNGKPIKEIKIELCRAMGDKTKFMQYTLKESIVSKVAPTGQTVGEDTIPTEQVAFRYGEIHWEYTPTDPSGGGKSGAAIKAGWSTLQNKTL